MSRRWSSCCARLVRDSGRMRNPQGSPVLTPGIRRLKLIEPEVETAIKALGIPQLIAPVWLTKRGVSHVRRRPHIGGAGWLGPARAHQRPVIMRIVLVRVVVE